MKTNQLIFLFCVSEVIYFSQLMSLSLFVGIGLSFLCIYLKNKQQQISFMLLSSLIIFFNDIYFDGTNQISSYYAYDIIGITLPILLIILYFFPAILYDIFITKKFSISRKDGIIFWYSVLGLIGIISSFFSEINLRVFISDISFIAIPFMVVYGLQKQKKVDEIFVIYTLFYSILFKLLIDAQNYFFGIGVQLGIEKNYFFDSIGNLSPIVVLFGFYLFIEKKHKLLGVLSIILGLFATVNSASRGTLILGLLSLFIYLISYYKIKKIKLLSIQTLSIMSQLLFFIFIIFLVAGDFFFWKISTIIPSENLSVLDLDFQSSTVRLMELINITAYLVENKILLNGVGFGGYFQDAYLPYSHLLLDTTSYDDSWIIDNTLYKPHLAALFVYLKTGLMGIIIWFIIFYRLVFESIKKIFLNDASNQIKLLMILVSCLSVLIYFKSFNSKLQFVLGTFMYIIISSTSKKLISNEE